IIFALVLTPFAEAIGAAAPWIFIAAAVLVAYTSKGKLAAVAALIPFVLLIVGLQAFIMEQKEATFTTSFFLGIATGPLIFDLFSALSPVGRRAMAQQGKRERSEEHTSELQSRFELVCRLLLEKKKYTEMAHR